MNIAGAYSRFKALGGLNEAEAAACRPLVELACDYVNAHSKTGDTDGERREAFEELAAAYALKLYDCCSDSDLTSFTAGDVKFTSSAGAGGRGERLWKALCEAYKDLINTGNFIFGRV